VKQFLAIIRGAPASGKTTIAKRMRSSRNKVVWLKVDNFKDFFEANSDLSAQKYVDECSLTSLEYMLENGFSVVMEKIFFDPGVINRAVEIGKNRGVDVKVFQIKCPLKILQQRDKNREGIKEGCRKRLGDEVIEKIYLQLERTYYEGAVELDTSKLSVEQCVKKICEELE